MQRRQLRICEILRHNRVKENSSKSARRMFKKHLEWERDMQELNPSLIMSFEGRSRRTITRKKIDYTYKEYESDDEDEDNQDGEYQDDDVAD